MPEEEDIFEAAAALPAAERGPMLDRACAGRPELRSRIEALLRSHDTFGFMESPTPLLPCSAVEQAGDLIGRYRLLRKLGEGGSGVVWMAEQVQSVTRPVALKIIKAGMDAKEVIARFETERQALTMMDHPNIARVLDAGATEKGRPFFVMELVKGIPITKFCDEQQFTARRRLDLFAGVCSAINHAHQKGIIHRNIKPSNVMVVLHGDKPVPKVVDFGIARAAQGWLTDRTLFTRFERFGGTPACMSPEQMALGVQDVDTRSDIYALGILLYELLTGAPPVDSKTLLSAGLGEMRRIIREVEPPGPSLRLSMAAGNDRLALARARRVAPERLDRIVKPDLDRIVMKAIEKDRTRRYETVNELAQDIRRHLAGEPVSAASPSLSCRSGKFARRNRLAALVAVLLIAALSVSVWLAIQAKVSRDDAEREVTRTKAANETNLRSLHLASMADYASALVALEEDFAATARAEPADGYGGKSRWHEAIDLLVRALEREPGNQLASVRLYDALSSRLQEKQDWPLLIIKHAGAVQSACYSPDGSKLLTASHDHTARLWDAVAGTPIGEPMQHDDIVWSAEFSSDGTRVCTASADKTVRVWDAATGRAIGEVLRHEDQVRGAVFSPDGSKIATASAPDGKSPGMCRVRVWNLTNGHSIGEPMLHPNPVKTMSFSSDGTKILTASHEDGRGFAQLWDAGSGKPIGARLLPQEEAGDGAALQTAALNPDGSLILAACGYTARLWNPATGEAVGEPMQHTGLISQAIFSPDGSTALTITIHDETGTSKVQLWNARTGKALGDPMKSARLFSQAGFSPDGARIATIVLSSNLLSSSVQIWDAATGRLPGPPMQHASRVHRVVFSPDGRKIVTACADGCARVWEVHHGAVAGEPLRSQDQLFEAGFNSDGTITASVAVSGGFPRPPVSGLRWEKKANPVWDPFTGKSLGGGKPAYADSLTPDGSRFIGFGHPDSNRTVRLYDSSTRSAMGNPMEHETEIQRAFIASDGTRIITITSGNSVHIWDAATCQSMAAIHHKDMVFVKLSPDGARLVTQSRDGTAQLIDLKTGKALGEPIRHDGAVTAAFSPESSRLVTTGGDGTVQVWDARNGSRLGGAKRHKDKVHAAGFSSDGARFATASDDGTAQIWDAKSGEAAGELLTLPVAPGANPVKFNPAGTRMLIICADDTARVWDALSRRPVGQPMRHPVRIVQADFSADGSTVLTVTPEAARLWEAETGRSIGEPMPLARQTASRDGLPQAALRQDGKRVVSATQDHTIRVWRTRTIAEAEAIAVIDSAVIDWARNLAGLSFNEDGEIYVIPDEERVRSMLRAELPPGPWSELKTWIGTPGPDRKVCAKSGVTFRQLAVRERDFNGDGNAESLDSALRYDSGIPLARLFLAAALEKNVAAKTPQDADSMTATRAAFLRRYDLEALEKEEGRMNKEELAALWVRAAKHLARLTPDKKVGIGAKTTTVREEALKAAQKAVTLAPQSTQAAQTLKDVQALSEKKNED